MRHESYDMFTPKFACHETHKAVTIAPGTAKVRGGNARRPEAGYQVYADLDTLGNPAETAQAPWRVKDGALKVRYYIPNYHTPKDPHSFKAFVAWLCTQVQEGKQVHIGCIGGHGRTGLVIAAMRSVLAHDKEAILWTRKNHCKKAVETDEQVAFLVKHFGCTSVSSRYGTFGKRK